LIHSKEHEVLVIKGPLGKGLGITPNGTYIAFVAGTGVLPFMDLAAHLVRKFLNLLDNGENHMIDPNGFKLILYVSYHGRN